METNTFPTKGNLILAKNTLKLSKQGYELLDKKRNVLIQEIFALDEKAKSLQADIDRVFTEAYAALQNANIEMGISNVEQRSRCVPVEETVKIRERGVMGVELPIITFTNSTRETLFYGLGNTTPGLDEAACRFNDVKEMIIELSAIETSAYRLAIAIKKTQKRANALKNVTIPKYESLVKFISEVLEERERDEFTRLKVVKKKSGN